MFFILSKVLYFLIQPLVWVLALMVFALFAKKAVYKKRALIAAIVLAFFLTNHYIYNQVFKLWEVETITADQIAEPYDIGILLGGFTNSNILPNTDRLNFGSRANRFLNAYELYRTGKIRKLLITSGSAGVLQKTPKEAVEVKLFLLRLGVAEHDIIVEDQSRNTYENAVFTKKLIDEKYPGSSCLMLTSASHMRRSIGCFEKAGLSFTPFSVDFITEQDQWSPEYWLVPDRLGFYYWESLIKEWVGYAVYWAQGYL